LLPQVRHWLERLQDLRRELADREAELARSMATGADRGGAEVSRWLRRLADAQAVLREFSQRQIQVKDLERGLVDFPALREGREVFLCWEQGEAEVAFWHELDAGYAGRARW